MAETGILCAKILEAKPAVAAPDDNATRPDVQPKPRKPLKEEIAGVD